MNNYIYGENEFKFAQLVQNYAFVVIIAAVTGFLGSKRTFTNPKEIKIVMDL